MSQPEDLIVNIISLITYITLMANNLKTNSFQTLDDLLRAVLEDLLELSFEVSTTKSAVHGSSSEIIGALFHLENPRARLSRTETKGTPFSALGELFWYLTQKNDLEFIRYYIPHYNTETDDDKTIYGGYGPRLFDFEGKINQVQNIIKLLNQKRSTRRAVIQLFDAKDILEPHKDIPCTCTLQFLIRNEQLQMFTSMRSNDAFLGLSHDIFTFTMLQEIIARALEIEPGRYTHSVGSLHLYEKHKNLARQYLKEGVQSTKSPMPAMPLGDPFSVIAKLLELESQIRSDQIIDANTLEMDNYWKDFVRLLQIYHYSKGHNYVLAKKIQENLSNTIYQTYINKRLERLVNLQKCPIQN